MLELLKSAFLFARMGLGQAEHLPVFTCTAICKPLYNYQGPAWPQKNFVDSSKNLGHNLGQTHTQIVVFIKLLPQLKITRLTITVSLSYMPTYFILLTEMRNKILFLK